jgi:hypothetical protein
MNKYGPLPVEIKKKYGVKFDSLDPNFTWGLNPRSALINERGLIDIMCRTESSLAEKFRDFIY